MLEKLAKNLSRKNRIRFTIYLFCLIAVTIFAFVFTFTKINNSVSQNASYDMYGQLGD